jgi:predicted aspartyl protease
MSLSNHARAATRCDARVARNGLLLSGCYGGDWGCSVNESMGTGWVVRRIRSLGRRCRSRAPVAACLLLLASGCATSSHTNVNESEAPATTAPVLLYRQTTRADEYRRLVVPVELNGQGPFYLLLDTGAVRSVLTPSALERLGLRADERRDVMVRGVSGRSRAHTVVVESFRLGDIEAREERLPVLKAQVLDGLDGILSMDHLRNMHLTADFASAEVRMLTMANGEPPANAMAMQFWDRFRQLIVVEARIGKHRVPAIIDTGATHTLGNVALLNKLIADAGGVLDGVIRSRVSDATDTVLETWDSRIGTLNLGSVAIDDLRVSFARFPVFQYWRLDRQPALLIGMDALSRMKSLTVDYRRRTMVLAPRESTDSQVAND